MLTTKLPRTWTCRLLPWFRRQPTVVRQPWTAAANPRRPAFSYRNHSAQSSSYRTIPPFCSVWHRLCIRERLWVLIFLSSNPSRKSKRRRTSLSARRYVFSWWRSFLERLSRTTSPSFLAPSPTYPSPILRILCLSSSLQCLGKLTADHVKCAQRDVGVYVSRRLSHFAFQFVQQYVAGFVEHLHEFFQDLEMERWRDNFPALPPFFS